MWGGNVNFLSRLFRSVVQPVFITVPLLHKPNSVCSDRMESVALLPDVGIHSSNQPLYTLMWQYPFVWPIGSHFLLPTITRPSRECWLRTLHSQEREERLETLVGYLSSSFSRSLYLHFISAHRLAGIARLSFCYGRYRRLLDQTCNPKGCNAGAYCFSMLRGYVRFTSSRLLQVIQPWS
jgi:hypothetical protein